MRCLARLVCDSSGAAGAIDDFETGGSADDQQTLSEFAIRQRPGRRDDAVKHPGAYPRSSLCHLLGRPTILVDYPDFPVLPSEIGHRVAFVDALIWRLPPPLPERLTVV